MYLRLQQSDLMNRNHNPVKIAAPADAPATFPGFAGDSSWIRITMNQTPIGATKEVTKAITTNAKPPMELPKK
jgi:hypothetical protein